MERAARNLDGAAPARNGVDVSLSATCRASRRPVRSIKSAILLAKTAEGGKDSLEDADVVKIIMKLAKQRRESAEQYTAAGRPELAENELAEAAVLDEYLPKQLSEAEVEEKLKEIIASVGASSPADMGKVMGAATKQLAGLADGRTISTIVRKLLA